jgi:hypothetical protein
MERTLTSWDNAFPKPEPILFASFVQCLAAILTPWSISPIICPKIAAFDVL